MFSGASLLIVIAVALCALGGYLVWRTLRALYDDSRAQTPAERDYNTVYNYYLLWFGISLLSVGGGMLLLIAINLLER